MPFDDGAQEYPVRVPTDAFEEEMYRQWLQARIDAHWPPSLSGKVGEMDRDGHFGLTVEQADVPFSLDTLLDQPYLVGHAWVCEDEVREGYGKVRGEWSLERVAGVYGGPPYTGPVGNDIDWPPVIIWSEVTRG